MNAQPSKLLNLPSLQVDVVEAGGRARTNKIKCEIWKNVKFETKGLEAYCSSTWTSLVFDAFVVAGAVQFCDHIKKRPATGWGREIELRIPVHDPLHWNSQAVSTTLHNTLSFLTGDRWSITFIKRKKDEPSPCQEAFKMPDGSRVIMPVSDGLDSGAVAGLMKLEHGNRLMLVRLGSKQQKRPRNGKQHVPFAAVPYDVKFSEIRSVETSGRSRGFKFALLTGIAAYLSQAEQIIVPESGQGALGPALVPVGQAYEDYRNHPLFMRHMEAFLLALFDHKVRYTFPRLWHTKGQTLAEYINSCPDSSDWIDTRSCWRGNQHASVSGLRRQCGICAACILRRMSVHSAGESEPIETYIWENLSAPRFEDGAAAEFKYKLAKGANYEYAIAGALHLDHMAELRHSHAGGPSLDRAAFQLNRALDLPQAKIRNNLDRLLKQHEQEWTDFISSLAPNSFLAQWAPTVNRHVA